ncbi:MAG: 6-carboxytetrahydropterin synthase QueD [Anaerophaga sp.]|uniref:6-pyruvoyl trahydropterin synthase family protein n=1 Tax=Anaerophaga thermohalophila TaxID=177400 RepID=UPI000492CAA4|nr:6-carboxytetrahydropterin synthase [Anaerophaga thermohalophila]MBZ4675517.1 6-carboxytetrahydropterin synthase QueD [Anaerophaga sp.]MDI3520862.1 6-pyruvoyltetrahydropterin/6-carboxytetrahydropterin synthase [Anaerophaga sp.]MDK2841586.1 6-pyruvoyltetrahydropterin/6-carboxytetrahydropterin synthase [Anaerophaga sp.]MDN5290946.1 6-pyruvoyltetrahydropterin/6-carboxytetrahydropterin synthase [Anaerophaga sp.]
MAKIRLTKEFRFEMSHALWNYDGLCKNIHGHSYILQVTIIGEPCNDENNPKYGMVMDFGDLKKIVEQEIVEKMDHSLVLSNRADAAQLSQITQLTDRLHLVSYQPTCENLLLDFVQRIKTRLPRHIKLFSLKLHETSNSFAEWYASDNE